MPQHNSVSVEAFNRSNAFQGWTPLPPPLQPQSPKKRGSRHSLWENYSIMSSVGFDAIWVLYPSWLRSLYVNSFEPFEAILWHGKQLGLFITCILLQFGCDKDNKSKRWIVAVQTVQMCAHGRAGCSGGLMMKDSRKWNPLNLHNGPVSNNQFKLKILHILKC